MNGTSAWQTDLEAILREVGDDFGIIEIRHPQALANARQTGFVWTRQQGLVWLAATRHYLELARDNVRVCAIIAPPDAVGSVDVSDKCLVICRQAEELYLYLHTAQTRSDANALPQVDASAMVDKSAVLRGDVRIRPGVHVGPNATVEAPVGIG